MQLLVARMAAAAVVASEVSARTSLETARQSAEDHAITAQTAAAAVATEWDSLVSRLALTEAEDLRAATASSIEAVEGARTTTAATETAARVAAREKATLEARVSELERDLGTATTDLATAGCQFSQVTNQLQVVFEEATRLRENNAKMSEDLVGESRGCFLSLSHSLLISCHVLTRWSWSQGRMLFVPG
jgi:chromosome segregation ATPase